MSIETTKEITEVRIISALSKTLVTKYNWSLVVTTMLIVTACYKLFFITIILTCC
ncbi:hypothetical protein [Candidatus Tisiphia endosymbiont of Micropterix aruncella]|uniref:hypothetical protein n=1 Tax=Candidatus Tisiphia endosymbiont of Micropterix aruncella TaxID=3066271 RepID=UPI003AA7B948